MRVLHITYEYPPRIIGQVAYKVRELVLGLSKLGVDVLLVYPAFADEARLDDSVQVYAVARSVRTCINVLGEAWSSSIDLVRKAAELFNSLRGRIDVVHVHEWLSALAGLSVAEAYNKPFIVSVYTIEHMRGDMRSLLSTGIAGVEKYHLERASVVIAESEEVANKAIEFYGIPRDKVRVCRDARSVLKVYKEVIAHEH